jgi:hypothetical protein
MKPDITEVYAGPDPVFRNTFVCFQLAVAEDARVFGHWLDGLLAEAYVQRCEYASRPALRAVAWDLCHLERFVAGARLDLAAVRRQLRVFARLIGTALREELRPQERTPAFRETFLALLPEEAGRAARSLGVFLQSSLAEAVAEASPQQARQGAAGELDFLASHLRELSVEAPVYEDLGAIEDERLVRFCGRMSDRLAKLAQVVRDQQRATAASAVEEYSSHVE